MIQYINIKGFKSIKQLELELRPINIFIGSNGAGKSNFISFFKLINSIFSSRLQSYIMEESADRVLYFGRKRTEKMEAKMIFTNDEIYNNSYLFSLAQNKNGGLFLDYEGSGYNVEKNDDNYNYFYNHNLLESKFATHEHKRHKILQEYISTLKVFHFHDTSDTSYLRRPSDINDNSYLKQDGRNLASFLYLLKVKHPKIFSRIEKTIQSIAPYVEKIILEPNNLKENEIELRWSEKGDPESNFSVYQFSDGTLRFIALAALLMQPDPPAVIIIDEPELGLHPFAIGILASMMNAASSKCQIIAATQSPGLISKFTPEDVIVIDRNDKENVTTFNRLKTEDLKLWLQDFTLGNLWERNIINSGQPFYK